MEVIPSIGPGENTQGRSIKPQAGKINKKCRKKKSKKWQAGLFVILISILSVIIYLPWVSPRKTVWKIGPTIEREYTADDGKWIVIETYKYLKEVEIPIMSELELGDTVERNRTRLGALAIGILKPGWEWNTLPKTKNEQILKCGQSPWTDADRPLCERLNDPRWEQYQGGKEWDWRRFLELFEEESNTKQDKNCQGVPGSWYIEKEGKLIVNLLMKCLNHVSRIITKTCRSTLARGMTFHPWNQGQKAIGPLEFWDCKCRKEKDVKGNVTICEENLRKETASERDEMNMEGAEEIRITLSNPPSLSQETEDLSDHIWNRPNKGKMKRAEPSAIGQDQIWARFTYKPGPVKCKYCNLERYTLQNAFYFNWTLFNTQGPNLGIQINPAQKMHKLARGILNVYEHYIRVPNWHNEQTRDWFKQTNITEPGMAKWESNMLDCLQESTGDRSFWTSPRLPKFRLKGQPRSAWDGEIDQLWDKNAWGSIQEMVGEMSLRQLKNSISKEVLMKRLAEGIKQLKEDRAVNWVKQLSLDTAPNERFILAVGTCARQVHTQAKGELQEVMVEFMNNQFAALITGTLDLTIPFVLIKPTPQEVCDRGRGPPSMFFNKGKRFCTDYRLLMEASMLGPVQARKIPGWLGRVRYEYFPSECDKPNGGIWVYQYDADPAATARRAAYWETLMMATRSLRNDEVVMHWVKPERIRGKNTWVPKWCKWNIATKNVWIPPPLIEEKGRRVWNIYNYFVEYDSVSQGIIKWNTKMAKTAKKLMRDSDHWPTLVPNTVVIGAAMAKWKVYCKGPNSNLDGFYGQLPTKDWYEAMGKRLMEEQDNEIHEMLNSKAPDGEIFWRWKIKNGVQCYPSHQATLVTGNYTWTGVWWTLIQKGITELPGMAAETAASIVKTMFDKTISPVLYTLWETVQYIAYPLLGLVLIGIMTKTFLHMRRVSLSCRKKGNGLTAEGAHLLERCHK